MGPFYSTFKLDYLTLDHQATVGNLRGTIGARLDSS